MRMKLLSVVLYIFLLNISLIGQDDPTLFTVEGKAITVSEFEYIYNKNNGDKADYSEKSLRDYLDLYTKFKLKVQRAKEMGLDTIPALQKELAGYRKQLASSYLVDKEVANKLVEEAVERMQKDVRVSHIFIAADNKSNPEKVTRAQEKMGTIRRELDAGKDFGTVAKLYSEDKASALKNGDLGFYTAPLPNGFYNFEKALYETEVGKYSLPFRTKMGFHIIKVVEKRDARGEMEVAHILVRKKLNGQIVENAQTQIDSLYKALNSGEKFEDIAKSFSDDKKTKDKGGYLGFFGINQFEKSFEDAAFSIPEDGSLSEPVETQIGWHIIKRLSKRSLTDKADMQRRIKSKIANSDRYEIAQKSMTENIKKESGFNEDRSQLDYFISALDSEFYSYKWQVPDMNDEFLMSFGNQKYNIKDFAEFAKKQTRDRLRFNKTQALKISVDILYDKFVEDAAIKYEEANLENKYPDFKSLMREYEEGILLFEATKIEVWDKASQDTEGIEAYYANNKDDYKWKTRAELVEYNIKSNDNKLVKKIFKSAQKDAPEVVVEEYKSAGDIISYELGTYEEGAVKLEGLKLKEGSTSAVIYDEESSNTYFSVIRSIQSPSNKTLDEARGYIIADYQDFLEKQWIEGLRNKYEVEVDEMVLDALIK